MIIIKNINLLLRFLLELFALGSLAYWGWHTGNRTIWRIVLSVGAPLLAAVVWGMFVAPKASIVVPTWLQLLLEIVVMGSAAVALYAAGRVTLSTVFLLIYIVNRILIYVWDQ
ncbi:uncharacterized protein DUF2568 [Paenibacillus taihuensis]|uniref:Uncharacterized protein DUF2568 n=1 Tax=Paenibacillus taihuensis TaxID=1156355 RepID=A0A3D9S756_9BACL|nr:YrdB family protein [Paenibacillus taihuensis]REE88987.1 uncharacterized protein DUF2568 [Paenibacillus taihuensis]